ncbi:MAG: oxidoreductase-like domain-containing protein [Oxalobacteraceae bacterium]|nr:oxidoreductase-like domain-containing protein [Oxalobacteraceae bacterium]
MNKPTPPMDGECCESACDPCVWDTYHAALRAWEASRTPSPPAPLPQPGEGSEVRR